MSHVGYCISNPLDVCVYLHDDDDELDFGDELSDWHMDDLVLTGDDETGE